ncbi:MSMEG_6728 family protein [Actinorugispora endophytica]|uniref:Uncharacterized protein n=1 Tax=Actinorugispora endophytica TaxID=1605990 RepID=A0A4R6UCM3_9ACTN|nr:MSMEG_6728 family protein [Actinorugispora endophytica]TDQ43646.1 hypothetical protein EV190_1407 [Actinorugispora endophytica]
MQTFLPHPGFADCARALDDRRLGKQRVEALQLLRALVWPRYGWRNHPATVMWRGFVPALVGYGAAVCREWRGRAYADAVLPALLEFSGGTVPEERWLRDNDLLPPWLGDEDVHRSHRASLARKDPDHYGPLFPGTPADLPYTWPGSVFPDHRLQHAGPPLDVGAALDLLGLTGADPSLASAVERLARGHDADLRGLGLLPPGAGLLAGLCTPGTALWLWPGAPPAPSEAVPSPTDCPDSGPAGRTAPSGARAAGPAELAAMGAEWPADPVFRFRRALSGAPPGPLPPGTGLVIARDQEVPAGAPAVLRLAWT